MLPLVVVVVVVLVVVVLLLLLPSLPPPMLPLPPLQPPPPPLPPLPPPLLPLPVAPPPHFVRVVRDFCLHRLLRHAVNYLGMKKSKAVTSGEHAERRTFFWVPRAVKVLPSRACSGGHRRRGCVHRGL